MDATHQEAPDDYKPGNKRPPKHTQFKPGQSGNPSGLRKNDTGGSVLPRRNLKTSVWAALEKKRAVMVEGKRCKMTTQELLVDRLIVLALKGSLKAVDQVLRLIHQIEGDIAAVPPPTRDSMSLGHKKLRAEMVIREAFFQSRKALIKEIKELDTDEKRKEFFREYDKYE